MSGNIPELNEKTPYYQDKTRISNSDIGFFIKNGPKFLRDYLDGKEEGLSGAQLEKGSMIHAYLLQKEEFWGMYKIREFKEPTKQKGIFISNYIRHNSVSSIELEDISDESLMLRAYKEAYSNKKSDNVILSEAKEIIDEYKDYIEAMNDMDNRISITHADLQMLTTIEQNVLDHKFAKDLIWTKPEQELIIHNELHVNWTYMIDDLVEIPCKSLIDRVIINTEKKTITLVDIKTTSKLNNFKESFDLYDYKRQMAFYSSAIRCYVKEELGFEVSDFDITVYIVAISNHGSYGVRVFEIPLEELIYGATEIGEAMNKISWHIAENLWDHSYAYYISNGVENLT